MNRARSTGFTLPELLTALVVVVVLAAIAIPSWRTHVLRTRRAEATAALVAVARAQDLHFGRQARYAPALTPDPPAGLGLQESSEHGHYRIVLTVAADGLAFTATARAAPGDAQADDTRCAEFRIDQLGVRRASDTAGTDRSADCWR